MGINERWERKEDNRERKTREGCGKGRRKF